MNCCDDYGKCNQGRDCPIRKERCLPERNIAYDVIEGFILLLALACFVVVVSSAAGYFLHWRLL